MPMISGNPASITVPLVAGKPVDRLRNHCQPPNIRPTRHSAMPSRLYRLPILKSRNRYRYT